MAPIDYPPDDPLLQEALIGVESNGNPNAVNPKSGAYGLGQIMPDTWSTFAKPGEDPTDPDTQKTVSKRILSAYYDKYGDLELGLAAYNAGPGTVDKYLERTSDKTFSGVSKAMLSDPEGKTYRETREYVPKILSKYSQLKKQREQNTTDSYIPEQPNNVAPFEGESGSLDEFNYQISLQANTPDFFKKSSQEQLAAIKDVYSQKEWAPEVDQQVKQLSSIIWDSAAPGELPSIGSIVGAPPMIEKDKDVNEAIKNWKTDKLQELRDQKVIPELLGTQLDDYLNAAGDQEQQAYVARNRSTGEWALNRAGNYVREGAKGVLGIATGTIAAVPRLAGAPFGAGQETADYIESRPEVWLGQPANDFLYYTDDNGQPVVNPDGTFKTHWQAQASQGLGAIGGVIGTLGVGAYAGVSKGILSAAAISTNTLTMANASFRSVYEKTGSLEGAYTAAAFAIPAGAIGSIGELGIVAGAFRPALKGLTLYDQARFIGTSFARNAFVNSASGAAADITQQFGESAQTNEPLDLARTGQVAAVGAVGGGIAGAGLDLVAGRGSFAKNKQVISDYQNKGQTELATFRNELATQKVVTTPVEYLDQLVLRTLGIEATKNADGTTLLTKKVNLDITKPVEAEEIASLPQQIKTLYTPDEITELGKEHALLAEKGVRSVNEQIRFDELGSIINETSKPEYLNTLKATEQRLAQAFQMQSDAPLIQYSSELGKWENVETGETFNYAKEALFPKELIQKFYKQDLSDLSQVKILDEEALPSIVEQQSNLVANESQISELNKQLIELKSQKTSLDQSLLGVKNSGEIEQLSIQKDKLAEQIKQAEAKLPKIEKEKKQLLDLKKERTAVDRRLLSESDDQIKFGLREHKKELSVQIQEVQNTLDRFAQQTEALRQLKAKQAVFEKQLSSYPNREKVQTIKSKQRELKVKQDQIRNRMSEIKAKIPGLKKAISERADVQARIDKVRAEGLGKRISIGDSHEIIIPKNASPDVKTEVLAHELAHIASDKIELSPDADSAVDKAIQKAQDKASVTSPSETASELFLPNIAKAIKVAEVPTTDKLTKKSKDALFSRREFIANQVAAVMLERAGKPIGRYKILPEVRAALEDVKLPNVETKATAEAVATTATDSTISPSDTTPTATTSVTPDAAPPTSPDAAPPTSSNAVPPAAEVTTVSKTKESTSVITEPTITTNTLPVKSEESSPAVQELSRGEAPDVVDGPLNKFKTDKLKETALSKTLTGEIPGISKVEYQQVSRVEGIKEADAYVAEKGTAHVENLLSNPESPGLAPEQRILLSDALLRKIGEEILSSDSVNKLEKFNKAAELASRARTSAAQQLALIQRFRGTESFGEFIAEVNQALRTIQDSPLQLSDLQIKELKALYDKARALPEGSLRNNYVQQLFNKTLSTQKMTPGAFWIPYLKNSLQGNLLSGIGTEVINLVGGTWMGPLFTALSHPIVGRGLVWRTMLNTLRNGTPFAQAKLVLEGKAANAMYGGLYDPSGLEIRDYSSIPRAVASLQNKFGTGIFRVLGAADSFMKTLSGEGYLAYKQYADLKAKYGNDPAKFTSEVAKIMIPKEDIIAAKTQAEAEGISAGLELTDADKSVRAYEILKQRDLLPDVIAEAGDWANATSLRGALANPVTDILHRMLYSPSIWKGHPFANAAKTVIFPFGRAILALSDFAVDFVPGNIAIEKATRAVANKFKLTQMEPRNAALQERLKRGQIIGTTLAATMLALSRSGLMVITGDPEQVLDRGGEGDSLGKKAKNRAQFKEAEQKGVSPFSILFPGLGGAGISYKDIPGLNALMYGLYHVNKKLDAGASVTSSAVSFFTNAFTNAIPFLGGNTTLNSPYTDVVKELLDPEVTEQRVLKALKKVGVSTSKMAIPGSSLLRDVKNLYDSTPEETNQEFAVQVMANIPVISELSGSKPALNRFGKPVERTTLERIPGVGRIIEEQKVPTDPTMYKLYLKGLIIPELQSNIKIDKSDYANAQQQATYTKTREDRLGSAYAKILTPDEWYQFIQATGPYVETAAKQVLDSNIPTPRAQMILLDRVKKIEDQAMKRYIRTGKFALN